MPHMVIFRDVEGRPGYHQAEAIEDAVRFVEQLRNEQDVTETRIFSMQEVPIEFRTYYRVALAPPPAPAAVVESGEAEVAAAPVSEPAAEPEGEQYAEAEVEVASVGAPSEPQPAGNGRFGRFGR